jgi:UDP-glucose 4-epimerase
VLKHLHAAPSKPRRVVLLGAGGFIAGAVAQALSAEGVAVLPLGRPAFDLLQPGAAKGLAAVLRPDDVLVFASAKAPVKNVGMLRENIVMAEAVCTALKSEPVAHVVYISSDAVYKDSPGPLSESSCAEPSSLHGAMHLAREVALNAEYGGPLAIVRATLVYGLDDPHNGYGPNRFRRLAAEGKDIVLFGEGEERRDHVDVEDVATLVSLIVKNRTIGIANAVSGQVVSFRELAEFAASEFAPRAVVKASPRSGPMPHNGYRPFQPSAALKAFPGFRFKSWREGLSAVHRRMKAPVK